MEQTNVKPRSMYAEYTILTKYFGAEFMSVCFNNYQGYQGYQDARKKATYQQVFEVLKFIGKKIKFHYTDERESDIFIPTHIDSDFEDDILLLWDNQYRYCTLEYAIENEIK